MKEEEVRKIFWKKVGSWEELGRVLGWEEEGERREEKEKEWVGQAIRMSAAIREAEELSYQLRIK